MIRTVGQYRFVEKAPLLLEVLLVLLFFVMFATWFLPNSDVQADVVNYATETPGKPLPAVDELASVELFGVRPKAVKADPVVRPKPSQPINIKLLGTVVAEKGAAAIVRRISQQEQQVFFVGDEIQPGVKLHEVKADAITVEQAGRLEEIRLEKTAHLNHVSSTMQPHMPKGAHFPPAYRNIMPTMKSQLAHPE